MNSAGEFRIADFGISRTLNGDEEQCQTFVGTNAYMSPERVMGNPYHYPTDVWALGLSLIFCALGRFPYSTDAGQFGLVTEISSQPPPSLDPEEFSAECCDFVDKCLFKVCFVFNYPCCCRLHGVVNPAGGLDWPSIWNLL